MTHVSVGLEFLIAHVLVGLELPIAHVLVGLELHIAHVLVGLEGIRQTSIMRQTVHCARNSSSMTGKSVPSLCLYLLGHELLGEC